MQHFLGKLNTEKCCKFKNKECQSITTIEKQFILLEQGSPDDPVPPNPARKLRLTSTPIHVEPLLTMRVFLQLRSYAFRYLIQLEQDIFTHFQAVFIKSIYLRCSRYKRIHLDWQ